MLSCLLLLTLQLPNRLKNMPESIQQVLSLSQGSRSLPPTRKSWWGPVWRGLIVENTSKHYRAMGRSLWLYLYLIVHADRKSGTLRRLVATIARDMGLSEAVSRRWLRTLRRHNYVITKTTGRALEITIVKWRPLGTSRT